MCNSKNNSDKSKVNFIMVNNMKGLRMTRIFNSLDYE